MEEQNTMQKVLGTFDGFVDNATTIVGGAASKVGEAAGTVGRKTSDALGTGVDFVGENVESVVTFAKGLFGG